MHACFKLSPEMNGTGPLTLSPSLPVAGAFHLLVQLVLMAMEQVGRLGR